MHPLLHRGMLLAVTTALARGGLAASTAATGRDDHSEQAHAKRGRACPAMGQVRCAAVIGRRRP